MQTFRPAFQQCCQRLHLGRPVNGDAATQHRYHQLVERVPKRGCQISPQLFAVCRGGIHPLQDRPDFADIPPIGVGGIELFERLARHDYSLKSFLAAECGISDLICPPQTTAYPCRTKPVFDDRPVD